MTIATTASTVLKQLHASWQQASAICGNYIMAIPHNPARTDKSEGGFWGAAGASETYARAYGEQHAYNSLQTRREIIILLLSMLFF